MKKKRKIESYKTCFSPSYTVLANTSRERERERERLSHGYSAYSRAGVYECHFFFQYIICIYIIVCMYSMYKYVYNMYIAIV